MSTLVEELSARAKALSSEDRARLAEEFLDSLDGESYAEAEAEAEAAWATRSSAGLQRSSLAQSSSFRPKMFTQKLDV